jgi:hypothetical protein
MKQTLQFIAGFVVAAASAAAQGSAPAAAPADSTSPILAPKPAATPLASNADPAAAYRPASPAIAQDISSGLPGYNSPEFTLKPGPSAPADKPKNQIPRLSPAVMSQYVVYGKRIPVFRTRDLYTQAGLIDLALKQHPGLHIGNFFNLNSKIAYATAMKDAMFAERQDLVDTTLAMAAGGDTEEAAVMQQAIIDESFESGGQDGPVATGPAPR